MLRVCAGLGLIWLTCVGLGAQGSVRDTYQRAIDRDYPGFHIVPIADLERPREAQDGVRGSLVAGKFDFDSTIDFAAYIVPKGARRQANGSDAGKFVICLGVAGGYKCDAQNRPFPRPVDSQLKIVPPGRYNCYGTGPAVTTIASVGETSQAGGGFYARSRDGALRLCITRD